jgi:putative DNA primase/helicase
MTDGAIVQENLAERVLANCPAAWRELSQWVAWRAVPRDDGRTDKVPINPHTGGNASSTNAATWGTLEKALACYERRGLAGVGFVVKEADTFCGVDFDHVVAANGSIAPDSMAKIRALDSYAELSPSGTGAHVYARAKLPPGRRKMGAIEFYDQGRFFTFTGNHLPDTPREIEARQGAIERLHAETVTAYEGDKPTPGTQPPPSVTLSLDDTELLDRARNARNAPKFVRLWAGRFDDYPSQSEADAALCSLLAFWAQDAAQLDRLFRQSGLYRPKWDQKRGELTYGELTVQHALETCAERYTPPLHEPPPPLPEDYDSGAKDDGPPTPPRKTLPILSADDLLQREFPEPEWIAPGILPTGLAILGGRPKIGKSWLCLQLALAVATGGVFLGQRVKQRPVLFLALEDSPRRLQSRMRKMGWPENTPSCDFVPIGGLRGAGFLSKADGREALLATLEKGRYQLCIIDTLGRSISGDYDNYADMTRALAPLQALAQELDIAVLFADHQSKGGDGADPIASLLGSIGKSGVADTVLSLYKQQGKSGAVLATVGRDGDERRIALAFDGVTGCWQSKGEDGELAVTEPRQQILHILGEFADGLTMSEVVDIARRNKGPVYKDLQLLVEAGLVAKDDRDGLSVYSLPPSRRERERE